MKPDVASYVEREADDELFERAQAGDFCYVLTPRQMGKSSLMVRTAGRLEAQGVRTATIDLSGIGGQDEQMTAEQWYYGIAHTLCRELGLDVDLDDAQVLGEARRLAEVQDPVQAGADQQY